MEGALRFQAGGKGMTVEIGRTDTADYGGILAIQARYLVGNLSPEERKDGFLSAEFSLEQIAAMASDLGIVAARSDGEVVGFMCASRMDFVPRPTILDSMLKCLDGVALDGRSPTEDPTFIYGPVCLDREYRGTGLLRQMFERLKKDFVSYYELGVAFVAVSNPRSLNAHVNGLGMTAAGLFDYGGNRYHALVFSAR
jgi:hypothetical protein